MPSSSDGRTGTDTGPGGGLSSIPGSGDPDDYTTIRTRSADPEASGRPDDVGANGGEAWVTTEKLTLVIVILELIAGVLKLLITLIEIFIGLFLPVVRLPVRVILLGGAVVRGFSSGEA